MSSQIYKNNILCIGPQNQDGLSLVQNYTGPIYVYSLASVQSQLRKLKKALPGAKIYYALKANHNFNILKTIQNEGAGLDIVSGGELALGVERGFLPENIIFSGVGKRKDEIDEALNLQIHQINVESVEELIRIAARHKLLSLQYPAPIVLRVNPHIAIESHPYISTGLNENKFGIPEEDLNRALEIIEKNKTNLELKGLSLHLGSQMLQLAPLRVAVQKMVQLYNDLKSRFPRLHRLDLGGGLGIDYQNQDAQFEDQILKEYSEIILSEIKTLKSDSNFEYQLEPGRWIVAHSGVLLTQVQYIKRTHFKNFVIVDTGMHHLLRPALYQAYHKIIPVLRREGPEVTCDIVGPICESSDFLGKSRTLSPIEEGDYLAILDVGAYGSVLANTYNLQPQVQEVCL